MAEAMDGSQAALAAPAAVGGGGTTASLGQACASPRPAPLPTAAIPAGLYASPANKPFLGGFRHVVSGRLFHHAATQTPGGELVQSRRMLQPVCAATQTGRLRSRGVQCPHDTATQYFSADATSGVLLVLAGGWVRTGDALIGCRLAAPRMAVGQHTRVLFATDDCPCPLQPQRRTGLQQTCRHGGSRQQAPSSAAGEVGAAGGQPQLFEPRSSSWRRSWRSMRRRQQPLVKPQGRRRRSGACSREHEPTSWCCTMSWPSGVLWSAWGRAMSVALLAGGGMGSAVILEV